MIAPRRESGATVAPIWCLQEPATGAQQTSVASTELSRLAADMHRLVARFSL
ncbi:hypothetical protein [Pseudomonas sp. MWU12-2345]|uniref:hypothetical protein n=1 Tax=Pseudomonas sp. MWU12-2345 TaxID=2928689 RepID=UPI00200DCB9F|nr:hypothetical protein [Pseudomonas sp. MWU12-2345]